METIFSGGFYSQSLREFKTTADLQSQKRLSLFSLLALDDGQAKRSVSVDDQFISAVYSNLIKRGLPTLPSILVERSIAETIKENIEIKKENSHGSIKFVLSPIKNQSRKQGGEWQAKLTQAHFPVDPRISFNDFPQKSYDSGAEAAFHTSFLPKQLGRNLPLLIQTQRSVDTMLADQHARDFINQRVDFSVELSNKKLVFEVDGSQHMDVRQTAQDQRRDEALTAAGWKVIRIPANQVEQNDTWDKREIVEAYIRSDPAYRQFELSFDQPLWNDCLGQSALALVLAPFGVARIQRALLNALGKGVLSFEMPEWNIVIFERDVRCAKLAMVDFMQHLRAFWDLMGKTDPLPTIVLKTFYTPEFSEYPILLPAEANLDDPITVYEMPISDLDAKSTAGDLFIDLSMLIYQGYAVPEPVFYEGHIKSSGVVYIIRNCFRIQEKRYLQQASPFAYKTDPEQNQNFKNALLFFLKNIFRKRDFRKKQVEIIARALALKPVIGLLPTGAGKSICYQLAGLLQPGLTMVIDPLISLMQDQVENLRDFYAIDWVGTLNSQLDAVGRKNTMQQMAAGGYLFMFLSPERLQNKEFRKIMKELTASRAVSYAVIDEAHCVSEWGHDFRTSYLNMAKTIQDHARYLDYNPVVIALTGTASYAVLSDVQREIGVDDEAAKVSPESMDREELVFEVIIDSTENKYQVLKRILRELPAKFEIPADEFYLPNKEKSYAGIIFTPHVNGDFGAYNVHQNIFSEVKNPVHFFSGEVPRKTIKTKDGKTSKQAVMPEREFADYKMDVQRKFKNNEFNVLVATKAFGMGIDKPNIKFTIHYNIPQSLEAYYQEAGRAGRGNDKINSNCYIIYSDDKADEANAALAPNATNDDLKNVGSGWGGGDIHRLLFLHNNAYQGKQKEFDLILELLKSVIYPNLQKISDGQTIIVYIRFDAEGSRNEREKSIYRLVLIGLVQDYSVDFDRKHFEVRLARLPDQSYIQNLQAFIQRYHTRERSEAVPEQIKLQKSENTIEKCLGYLLDFVYQEIERKRRAAIRSMAEVTRKASQKANPAERNRFIHEELRNYLENSPFTEDLLELVKKVDLQEWHDILQKKEDTGKFLLKTVNGVRQLFGSCRRTLESYPDHPSLLFLSALGRLLLPESDKPSAMNEIRYALNSEVLSKLPESKRDIFIQTVFEDYHYWLKDTSDYEALQEEFTGLILNAFPSRTNAIRLFEFDTARCENICINLALQNITAVRKQIIPS